MTPHVIFVSLLRFVIDCGWSDDGSVEQRRGIIGSDAHGQIALKNENRSMSDLTQEYKFFRRNGQITLNKN